MKTTKQILIYSCAITLAIFSISSCAPKKEDAQSTVVSDSATADNSLKSLNDRIAANPKDANAYYERAKLYLRKNILEQSYNDLILATRIDSMKAEYYFLLGDVSFRGLQIQKSVQAFEKCLVLDPHSIDANLKLSELYMYLKAYPKSIHYANEVLRIDKNKAKAYFLKGFVYKESGDTGRAISSFTTVVELDPENYDAYMQLGLIYGARGNDLAIQYYSNALRVYPSSEEALYNRGLFYQEGGQLESAEEDYKNILKKNPKYKDAYFNLGFIALVNRDDYAEAIKLFTTAIDIDKDYVEAYYNRGFAYEYLGNKQAAIKDYRSALSIFPSYSLAIDRLRILEK